ncbi:MAG TPA: hypothetical protein PKB10_02125 [Tepidisphaeraceae bacterium]|nr:hypothetical protein [Tepidisphaeraceae bacterium]
MRTIMVIVAMMVAVPEAMGQRRGGSSESLRDFDREYGVLSEQNMFHRERRRPSPPSTRPTTTTPPAAPERAFVLVGVVFEDGQVRAYIEDGNTGSIRRLTAGEAIARGTIAAIEIDAVAYEHNGDVRWIELGHDFTGALPQGVSAGPSPPPAPAASGGANGTASTPAGAGGSTPAPAAGVDPNEPGISVEERMRRRRAAQQGGR